MTITATHDTPEFDSRLGFTHSLKMGAVKIYAGSMVVIHTDGYAKPGVTETTGLIAGVAQETVDNSGGAAGALSIKVRSGVFKLANSVGDPILQADVGTECFIEDAITVSDTDTNQSSAGTVYQVDTDGVWVAMRYPFLF